MNKETALEQICQQFGIHTLYAFGSRAGEVSAWLQNEKPMSASQSDVDVGILASQPLAIKQKTKLALLLEDFLGVNRVDIIALPDADPFVAANIIRGERLYAADDYLADEYDLYVLRRAGDLIPLEQERQQLIMENLA